MRICEETLSGLSIRMVSLIQAPSLIQTIRMAKLAFPIGR